ncbi:hypothetical protein, partial [Ruminococcus callidus]|uniref:hypothetical protein n=1 Tax=Ruminococcus callidus TaxID=40519 RepID=UPI003FD8EF7D
HRESGVVEYRCIRCLVNGFVRSEANGQMPQYLMPHLLRYREKDISGKYGVSEKRETNAYRF